ncbi:hypothetical protein [Paraburkholderia caffeinilytica]|uniref:hypothetical protein n=1 Tax=Paraburkholderia caffeinilytica TaxID=1761016 RepID=UPI003D9FBC62
MYDSETESEVATGTYSHARAILRGAGGWIDWDNVGDRPDWQCGGIVLDGRFTLDELRAILVFARHAG